MRLAYLSSAILSKLESLILWKSATGWHELITTRGRWHRNVQVPFVRGEFKVFWARLDPDEEAAVLIDRFRNLADLNRPFDECQILAARHGYELCVQGKDGEILVEQLERMLSLVDPQGAVVGSGAAGNHEAVGQLFINPVTDSCFNCAQQ